MTSLCLYDAFECLKCVEGADERMAEHNARSRIAHNSSYLFAHFGLIAVARALGAEILSVAEAAVIKPVQRIGAQLTALGAKLSPFRLMHAAAIDLYHLRQHFFFAGYSVFFLFLVHDNLPL